MWSLNPIDDVTQIAGAVASGAVQAGGWVANHKLETVGIVAGVVSAATGVGALIDVGTITGVTALDASALAGTSIATGLTAGALGLPGCLGDGDHAACLGAGLGLSGAIAGAPDLIGGLLGLEEDSAAAAVLHGLGVERHRG